MNDCIGFYAVSASEGIFTMRTVVQLKSHPHLLPLTSCKGLPETYSTMGLEGVVECSKIPLSARSMCSSTNQCSPLASVHRPLADNSHFGPTVFSPTLAQSARWADSHFRQEVLRYFMPGQVDRSPSPWHIT